MKRLFPFMLLLVGVLAIGLTSCGGSDDNDDNGTQGYASAILGAWYYDDYEYWFSAGGTGEYRCEDIMGDFHYTVEGQVVWMRQFTYWDNTTHSVWKGEDMHAFYDPEKNTLYIDGKIYTRTKPKPKPGEEPVDSVVTK